jgi:hypothetical protein
MTVSEFGPLPLSLITTTRKFFTVLASVLIFGHHIIGRQWMGAVLVFTGEHGVAYVLQLLILDELIRFYEINQKIVN